MSTESLEPQSTQADDDKSAKGVNSPVAFLVFMALIVAGAIVAGIILN